MAVYSEGDAGYSAMGRGYPRGLAIDRVIARKVRHTAETSEIFAPIDQLIR